MTGTCPICCNHEAEPPQCKNCGTELENEELIDPREDR